MSTPNAANSGATNSEGQTDVTVTVEKQDAGAASATTGATTNQTAGKTDDAASDAGKISFTPEQQAYMNSLIKSENQKAVDKAMKKANDEKDLSEKEKADRRADEAEKALAERDKRDAFKAAVGPAKVVDADALYKLIGGELEFENDKFKNLTKSLDAAKVSYPFLFPSASASADGGQKDDETIVESAPGVDRIRSAYAEKATKT